MMMVMMTMTLFLMVTGLYFLSELIVMDSFYFLIGPHRWISVHHNVTLIFILSTFLICMRLECTIICCLTYLQQPKAVVFLFYFKRPMFRARAKFGLENGTNEGETDAIKMYKLQKLAR